MRKQFPFLEVLGGILGIGGTAYFMWQRFAPWSPPDLGMPPAFYSDTLLGNILLTIILLVPFLAIIIAAFTIPPPSRWPILLSSSLLSLFWLEASKFVENFPHPPFPTPSGPFLPVSFGLFLPGTLVLIAATGLSLRQWIVKALPLQKAIVLGCLSLLVTCLLGASFYILFLHQEAELWTRAVPNGSTLPYGEWIRVSDWRHMPELAGAGLAQQSSNFGVVEPIMAWISSGLLAVGILCLAILFRIGSQFNPDFQSSI